MADDIADAHFLLDELSKTECTVTIAPNEPWGEVRVLPSLRDAARFARDQMKEAKAVEIIAHTQDGDEAITGKMLAAVISEA